MKNKFENDNKEVAEEKNSGMTSGDNKGKNPKCSCGESDECCCENSHEDEKIELMNQIAALKDTILRKAAETENLRKRLEKEKDDAIKYANKNFASDLLSILDNFERINANISSVKEKIENDSNLKSYFEGIAICEKALLSTFQKYGISKINVTAGDVFNHEIHQAMLEVEDEKMPAGSVVQILQSGYKYNDRLLRPTMVSVSKKK